MDDKFILSPMTVGVIGIILASAGLLIYHFIVVLWCNRREIDVTHQETPQHSVTNFEELPSSIESSIAALIPTCKYTRDIGLVSKSEDVACSVCLNEFKDGEAVRVLPECLHTFHVPCIDMWLYSHSNCPLCRTDTSTPVYHLPEADANTMGLPD